LGDYSKGLDGPESLQLVAIDIRILDEAMVEQIDVSDGGELGHGQERGCSPVIEGSGLFEEPACVQGSSLELHREGEALNEER
jgi:hypothetical protein